MTTQNAQMLASEWIRSLNPFNPIKVLMWREQLEAIAKGEFLPPISISTDPTNKCNYNCKWCNSGGFRSRRAESMPPGHLLKLADFYKDWGVRSTCVAGGGEPTLHPEFTPFLYRLAENGIDVGVTTNGSALTDEQIEAIVRSCRWCGFSMDAGERDVYNKLHGLPKNSKAFDRVLDNMAKLVAARDRLGSRLGITYKFLAHPGNTHTIFKAAERARSLGANEFYMRPVGLENIDTGTKMASLNFDGVVAEAVGQIEAARSLETEHFRVFATANRFGAKWERRVGFKSCIATPLQATFAADGLVYLCFDTRGREDLVLGPHVPDPYEIQRMWSSDRHKEIIARVDPNKCPRCTYGPYHEVIEMVIQQDCMCRFFP